MSITIDANSGRPIVTYSHLGAKYTFGSDKDVSRKCSNLYLVSLFNFSCILLMNSIVPTARVLLHIIVLNG